MVMQIACIIMYGDLLCFYNEYYREILQCPMWCVGCVFRGDEIARVLRYVFYAALMGVCG